MSTKNRSIKQNQTNQTGSYPLSAILAPFTYNASPPSHCCHICTLLTSICGCVQVGYH